MNRLVVLVLAALAACATVPAPKPKPKTLACQNEAQWFTNDAQGQPIAAVIVCFGEDGHLMWQSRALTSEEYKKLTTPAAVVEPPAPPKTKPKAKK